MKDHTIRPGDVIRSQYHAYTVDRVLYQTYYGPYDNTTCSDWWGYDVEFIDPRGEYHHWKQNEDGGEVVPYTAEEPPRLRVWHCVDYREDVVYNLNDVDDGIVYGHGYRSCAMYLLHLDDDLNVTDYEYIF